ncbi:MAG: P-loop NTPase fold protein [Bacilli bacterium]
MKSNKDYFYNVILINGPWGIGKTYYIKKYLEGEQYIYLSAFGIKEVDELKYALYHELAKIGAFFLKKFSELYGNTIEIGPISLPIPNIKIDLEKTIKEKLKDKRIVIIIDDLERKCNYIEIKELLGFIEALSQIDNIEVIVISNGEKLEKEDKIVFEDFKEKVVKKIYNIDRISQESINEIIDEKYNKEIFKKYINLSEYKNMIIEFTKNHNINNLRTLQKAILFLNEVVANIPDDTKKEDIIELMKVCFAVAIEENDGLYMQEENKKPERDNCTDDIYKQEDYCILKHYFSEGIFYNSRIDLIRPIIRIYNAIDEQKSYSEIRDYFKIKNSPITKNKALFYCSKEQIEERINKFIEKDIKKKSNKNVISWFKELNQLYPWINKLKLDCKISNDEIQEAMNMYVKEMDCSKQLYEIIDHHIFFELESSETKQLYKILKSKMAVHYINKKIEELENSINKGEYNRELLDNIFYAMNNPQLVSNDIREKIGNRLYSKHYFIPDLNSEIDEDTWSFAHRIWHNICSYKIEDKKLFSKCVSEKTKESNELGKYRLASLNEQYGIDSI